MDLYDEFINVTEALGRAGVDFAVCGGIAVGIHGFVRFTEDIDLMVPVDDLEPALEAVRAAGYTIDSGRIPFEAGTPEEHEIHRVVKIEGEEFLQLDLVLVNQALRSVWDDRGAFEWQGRSVPCVSRRGLIEMKRRAGRSKDQIDLEELEKADEEATEQ